jgi:hypothetical protein
VQPELVHTSPEAIAAGAAELLAEAERSPAVRIIDREKALAYFTARVIGAASRSVRRMSVRS